MRSVFNILPFLLVLQGVLESFVGTALTGAVFCMLAGQPLTILSSTGPVLVFERLLFNFSRLEVTDQNPPVALAALTLKFSHQHQRYVRRSSSVLLMHTVDLQGCSKVCNRVALKPFVVSLGEEVKCVC